MRSESGMPSLPVTVLKEPKGLDDISISGPCSAAGIGTLSRLGTRQASVKNPDGSVSEGLWHWWTSDSCKDPATVAAIEQMQAGRASRGLDPAPECPMPDIVGKTCIPKFYPERTLYPDGSFREQSWTWGPAAPNKDQFNLVENWNVYFTPEEAQIYASLLNDEYLKALDSQTVLAIYYSLLNWRCIGKINAILEPSPVSPQSLSRQYDSGSQSWLEFWERSLRDRIWMVRTDLRQVQLPDGRLVTGLRPPTEISRPPSCTTQTGQIIGYVAAALTMYAGVPTWLDAVVQLPQTVVGFRDMLRQMGRASEIQQALLGKPSAVEQVLIDQASGQKSPAGEPSGAVTKKSPVGTLLLLAGIALAALS